VISEAIFSFSPAIFTFLRQSLLLVTSVFFLFLFWSGWSKSTSSPRVRTTALDEEYVFTSLAANKDWFYSGSSYMAWCIVKGFRAVVL